MKSFISILVLLLVCQISSQATHNNHVRFDVLLNNTAPNMESGYYVVIGAYAASKEYYAKRYVSKVNSMGYESSYGFSNKKNLFFVYLRYTQNYRESITKMREARQVSEFKEAWVFVAFDEDIASNEPQVEKASEVLQTEVVGKLDEMYADRFDEKEEEEESKEEIIQIEENISEATSEAELEEKVEVIEKADEVELDDILITESKPKEIENLGDLTLHCSLVNARNSKGVEGEIQIVDAERAKLLKVVQAGDFVQLKDPNNGTGKLLLICDVFGYKKTQRMINYYKPLPDTTQNHIDLITDIYAVNFDLLRYRKGDIATMYNVYFFKDAALMRPESKFEINNLLNMMKENPDYKIKIHGHVNGKHPGKIISAGDSNEYFALNDNNEVKFGSATELSRQRAEVIKKYLEENGVSSERMEVKAWGGKRMLHDKHSTMAKHNVRVEIEILEE